MAVTLPEAWQLCTAMDRDYDARFRARQQAAEQRIEDRLKEADRG